MLKFRLILPEYSQETHFPKKNKIETAEEAQGIQRKVRIWSKYVGLIRYKFKADLN